MTNNKELTVVQYLVTELAKLGIEDFFGLPGDYNFNILDAVIEDPKTNWVGCTNELNAGYAADGYARLKGYGALVTTYGVGELSAVNAIAGSFSENIPVIQITGVPATRFINHKTLIHHNFRTPDYQAFERVYSNVTCGTACLSFENAKEEIDRLISLMIKEQKPVYIAIPADVCSMPIGGSVPCIKEPKSDTKNLKDALAHALKLLKKVKRPVILADVLIERFKAKTQFTNFLNNSLYPVSTLLMGKGVVEEDYVRFMGTFQGQYGNLEAYRTFEESDGVICIGTVISDINTLRFSLPFAPSDFINIDGNYTIIENKRYENVLMKDILEGLSQEVLPLTSAFSKPDFGYKIPHQPSDVLLSASYFYPKFQEFLKEGDSIFAETGITLYALAPLKLPVNAELNTQVLWGSIGWATPAAFGGAMALKNKNRRTILITGEGSHQLTAQEVSSMMRYKQKPVIFVINNSGYTIERYLSKDPSDPYNDIANWNYSKLPEVFEGEAYSAQVRTNGELDAVLENIKVENKTKLCYIEVFTKKMDAADFADRVLRGKKLV